MAVVTVSRQYGSGGDEIVRLLCDRLGCRFFDKNLMARLSEEAGIAGEAPIDLSEDSYRVEGLIERLFGDYPMPFDGTLGWPVLPPVEKSQRLSIVLVQSLIRAAHTHGNVVIVGRGGQIVLRDKPDVLHVRVEAPLEQRIRRVQRDEGLDVEAAIDLVSQRDQAATDFVRRFFHADPADASLYDLVINTGKIPPSAAVDLIAKAVGALPA